MASPFSGRAGRLASIAQGMQVQQGKDEAFGFLDKGQGSALSALGTGFGQARDDVTRGTGRALSALGSGYTSANNYYDQAHDAYTPLMGSAMGGYNLYGDATGANGADGAARARSAFTTGPGYQFGIDQGTEQALRAANAAGMTASGNTLTAVTDRATNMANQEYGNWVQRLAPYLSLAPQLVGAQAGIRRDQATLADSYGRGVADLHNTEGRTLADLARGLGTAEAGIHSAVAGNKANAALGVGSELGNIVSGGMMAGQQAAANRMNFGLSLASLGSSLLGGSKGLGGLFGPGGSISEAIGSKVIPSFG